MEKLCQCLHKRPTLRTGNIKRFVTFLLQQNINVLIFQWIKYREIPAFRYLPADLLFIIDQMIIIVNLF